MRQMQGQWAQLESWWPGMACHAQGAAAQKGDGTSTTTTANSSNSNHSSGYHSFLSSPCSSLFTSIFSLWQLSFFFRCGWQDQGIPWIPANLVNFRRNWLNPFRSTWRRALVEPAEIPNHRASDFTHRWLLSDPHVISKGELYDFWGNMTMKDEIIETWSTSIYLDDIPEILRFASTTSAFELPILNKSEEPLRTWTEKQLRTEKQIMPLALVLLLSARVFPLPLG